MTAAYPADGMDRADEAGTVPERWQGRAARDRAIPATRHRQRDRRGTDADGSLHRASAWRPASSSAAIGFIDSGIAMSRDAVRCVSEIAVIVAASRSTSDWQHPTGRVRKRLFR